MAYWKACKLCGLAAHMVLKKRSVQFVLTSALRMKCVSFATKNRDRAVHEDKEGAVQAKFHDGGDDRAEILESREPRRYSSTHMRRLMAELV